MKNLLPKFLVSVFAVAFTFSFFAKVGADGTPTLSTDKDKYSVGDTMIITGTNFTPNGTVTVTVLRPDHATDTLPDITADANGGFVTNYVPSDFTSPEPGRYKLTATDGTNAAKTAATEADAIGYNKGVYNKGTTSPSDNTGVWTTGNAGSHYLENQWAYYQYEITGVPNSSGIPSFDVSFNHFQSNTNALFIDAFANFRVCVDCTDQSHSSGPQQGMLNDGVPYPSASSTNWISVPATSASSGAPINHVNNNFNSNVCGGLDAVNTPGADHCFHVDGAALGTLLGNLGSGGNHTITIFYEAHLASTAAWHSGNENLLNTHGAYYVSPGPEVLPVDTAYGTDNYSSWTSSSFFGVGSATGSSRHFNINNQTAGSNGGLSLPIPTVPPANASITLDKVTSPSGDQTLFNFSTTGLPTPTNPSLADATPPVVWSNLAANTYTITEGTVPFWQLTSKNCTGGSQSTVITQITNGVSIALAAGDNIVCTFNNTKSQSPIPPTITTAIHNATHQTVTTAALGDVVHDSVHVSGAQGTPTGTVTFDFFNNGTCTAPAAVPTSSAFTLDGSGNFDATTFTQTLNNAGSYSFKAHYSGDSAYTPLDGPCEPLTVNKGTLGISTTLLFTSPLAINSSAQDSATVTGIVNGVNPTNQVTFNFFTNGTCASTGAPSGGGAVTFAVPTVNSNSQGPLGPGSYSFNATITGDSNYNPATVTSSCEPFTVSKGTTITSTTLKNVAGNSTIPNGSHLPLGSSVYDTTSVTPTPAGTPTGTVTYQFYTGSLTCAGSPTTETLPVGTQSSNHNALGAGDYGFVAVYSGDSNYSGSTGACEPFTIDKAQLAISTTVHDENHTDKTNANVPINSIMHDTATVTGGVNGFQVPAVSFTLTSGYTSSCSTGAVVANNGIEGGAVKSADSVALGAGSYAYMASVTGDNNYLGATGICEPFTVNKASPSISTTLSAGSVNAGTMVHDSSTLSNATSNAGGTVTYTVYTDSSCTQGAQPAGVKTVTNGSVPDSDPLTFNTPGDYYWQAIYSGDANNNGATSNCVDEHLVVNKINSTTVTVIHNTSEQVVTSIDAGSTVHDKATVTGSGPIPTGTVTFNWFINNSCTVPAGSTSTPQTLSGGMVDATSFSQGPLGAGNYSFQAIYSGDNIYNGSTGNCEPLTVNKVTPSLSTEIHDVSEAVVNSVALGSSVHDKATISGGYNPSGNVTFTFFNNGTCAPAGTDAGTVALSGGVAHPSNSQGPLGAGSYSFQAHYNGDNSNNAVDAQCESLNVNKAQLSISTTVHDASHTVIADNAHVALGTMAHDNATVTGGVAGFALPAISFNFDSLAIANGSTDAGFDATSVATSALTPGPHKFNATVAGDNNYLGATSSDEPFVVDQGATVTATVLKNALGDATIDNGSNVPLGTSVYDTATVTPTPAGTPTGTVTYQFYSAVACSGSHVDQVVNLSAGLVPNSSNQTSLVSGDYGFVAVYSGDSNYTGSTGACEPFHVNKGQLTVSTTIHDVNHNPTTSAALGSVVHDTASIGGQVDSIAPTGAVTFTFGSTCGQGAIATDPNLDSGNSRSVDTSPLAAGSYNFQASVAGDANYDGATSSCEPLTINKAQLTISTTVHDSAHNDITNGSIGVGSTAHDNATVTGGVAGFPLPTTSFTFDGGAIGNSASPEASFSATSVDTSALAVGNHKFNATVASSDNYLGATSADEPFSVVDGNLSISPATATNAVNQPHTITATVTKNDGSGSTPAIGVLVTFSIPSGSATFVGGVNTCTTNASGQCSVQINSLTTGANTIHATTTFSVGGVSLTRTTGDGLSGDSADASKTYVDANIQITPGTATNRINAVHTLTLHVNVNDGSGFVNAPDSTVINVSKVSGPGNLSTTSCTTSGGTGSCTDTLTSSTSGTTVVNGSVTISVGGVSLTRATGDANVGDSANAQKTWINPHTTISVNAFTQETTQGENVMLTISDKNDGDVPLTNDTVTLTYGSTTIVLDKNSSNFTGDNGNGIMDPGETWTWVVNIVITSDTTFNVAGDGTDPLNLHVSPTTGFPSEGSSITVNISKTTRTLGFWQTHTTFTSSVFSTFFSGGMPIGTVPHKGVITNIQLPGQSQLFGGFYASIPKTTTGAKRSGLDKARVQMLQQLLGAKLNCAAFGCGTSTMSLISQADAAYAGSNANLINSLTGQLDAYNNSGDTGAIPSGLPPTGKATPKNSQAIANLAFWDLP